ncbi:hypothetical protein PDN28_27250 [Bacillus cereus]|uniref:DUF6883 domain-containing protein n=1 Tax=Bacillus cereus group TaxID=86661 RepID=UPI002409463D|nr:DUF6883 domain-containing protein [Bacillus cereus]MDA2269509.1 hypothetical protein [Bacillus cereus]MDC7777530.1 hypothetical protein [Bacillus cereus]
MFGDYSTYLNEIIDIDRKKPLKFSSLYQAILNGYSEGKFKGVENFHLTLSGILERSKIHDDKLSKYLLNMEHERGKDKAKFFKNALGIELKDKQYLAEEILKKINFGEFKDVSFIQNPQYEKLRFVTLIIIEGRNGGFVSIDTVWQITENESPVLITAYPTHKKTVQ